MAINHSERGEGSHGPDWGKIDFFRLCKKSAHGIMNYRDLPLEVQFAIQSHALLTRPWDRLSRAVFDEIFSDLLTDSKLTADQAKTVARLRDEFGLSPKQCYYLVVRHGGSFKNLICTEILGIPSRNEPFNLARFSMNFTVQLDGSIEFFGHPNQVHWQRSGQVSLVNCTPSGAPCLTPVPGTYAFQIRVLGSRVELHKPVNWSRTFVQARNLYEALVSWPRVMTAQGDYVIINPRY
jgi:hypothetical protein